MTQPHTPPQSVYEALAQMAARHEHKTAIRFVDETITYGELLQRIDNAAENIRALGVGQNVYFAGYGQNKPDLLYCYYAAAKIGAIFVPINPNMTASEVAYAFEHSGAQVLFYDELTEANAKAAVRGNVSYPMENLKNAPETSGRDLQASVKLEDDFLTIYTSGSTGTPKAIMLDHFAQIHSPLALAEMWGVTEDDVTLVALPLGYLYGLSTAAAAGLQSGGTVVILPKFHPRDVLEALVAHKATIFHGVPTMYSMMLEYCEQRDLTFDLSGVKQLICAGSPMPEELKKRFEDRFGKALQDYYAMTECTPVFGKYADDPRAIPKGAVGRAAPHAIIRVCRPDMTECNVGEAGEFFVRGQATLKRYLGDPALTESSMVDGLFRSGDIGHRDADGFYYITGRAKDIIIRGGANISPSEVEHALASHPAVQDVCVVSGPDRIFGEVPVAFIVFRHGASASEEELIAHAETLIADFKVPKTYHIETELPLGKTGKVDRIALKKRVN